MNDTDLEKVLKQANVPEPRRGFWDELPVKVQRAIDSGRGGVVRPEDAVAGLSFFEVLLRKAAVPLAFAAA
jgi:hypothetical protein